MADTINTNLGSGLDDHYRDDLDGNFKVIVAKFGLQAKQLKELSADHAKILKKLDEIKKLEQQNAKNVAQNHKNIEQQVEILHDYFDVPIVWDGDDLILEKEE